ncbi:YcxB family protein [Paraclostridium sp. AKS81]|uniref:YcxB family protein n=1 Tax=Paraclostridium sp. AKS81 TaxID=2876117 RepID=UPI0021E0918D|nr:YcxB family protein [Paraclostridium sp. AKS81]MCU9811110.1 YcxB family protein [Paraclostridium sp. AKS81]
MKILCIVLIVFAVEIIIQIIKHPNLIGYYCIQLVIICIGIICTENIDGLCISAFSRKIIKSEIKEKICTLNKEKLVCMDKNTVIEIYHKDLNKIIEKNNTIYIFGENNILYLIIPNRAFKSDNQKQEFLQILKGFN